MRFWRPPPHAFRSCGSSADQVIIVCTDFKFEYF
nr:MAG TPA: hypothetical protein [Caudoviricetes sp.]